MSITQRDSGAGHLHGVWAGSRQDLVTYRYLGCSSRLRDRNHAEGRMRLRPDMRVGGGLLTAPVAIAMLDTAGINIDGYYHAACTQIDVHLLDQADDVRELLTVGTVVREARTAAFTEATFEDADRPGRLLGFGTVGWSLIGPTPPGWTYADPGPGVADDGSLPPLPEAYDAHTRKGGGYVIEGLSSRVGTDVLHHGPILVVLEATALQAASEVASGAALTVETACTRLVRAARKGPFVSSARPIGVVGTTVVCRAELRDRGADDCVVAVAHLRVRAGH